MGSSSKSKTLLHQEYQVCRGHVIVRVIHVDKDTYQRPVLLSFAPEPGNAKRSWGTTRETSLALHARAWRHISLLGQARALTVSWVWCLVRSSTISAHYSGDDVVDWLGLAITDPSPGPGETAHSFAAQYQQHKTVRLHASYNIRQKPILLTQLGQQIAPDQRRAWLIDALDVIHERYPEIRGLLLSPDQIRVLKPAATRSIVVKRAL